MAPNDNDRNRAQAAAAFARADEVCPFGPSFFLDHLGRFVRDQCPDPKEHLPSVQIRLADGTALDLCHIIGVSPHWVMFAVHEGAAAHDGMAIELVPFESIRGIAIRMRHADGGAVGFSQARPPDVMGAETLLRAAMSPDRDSRS